jgi:hypothetical protein
VTRVIEVQNVSHADLEARIIELAKRKAIRASQAQTLLLSFGILTCPQFGEVFVDVDPRARVVEMTIKMGEHVVRRRVGPRGGLMPWPEAS